MKGRLASARRRRDAELRRHVRGALQRSALLRLPVDVEIDALGTFCPEPVIRTQDRMAGMATGQVLLLLADDAGVEVDIPAWCLSTGNEYLGLIKEETAYRVFVRRQDRLPAAGQGSAPSRSTHRPGVARRKAPE